MSDSVDGLTSHGNDGGDLFLRLEEHLQLLLERHRESSSTIAELQGSLSDRDRQINALEQQLKESEQLRTQVAARLDGLIAEIDRMGSASEASESEVAEQRA